MGKLIIAGHELHELGRQVSKETGIRILENHIRVFPDQEIKVTIPEIKQVKGQEIIILKSTHSVTKDYNWIELLQILCLLNEFKAKKITLITPYLGYSRQDKRFLNGECITRKMITNILKCYNVSKVIGFDLHFHRNQGEFELEGITYENVTAQKNLIDFIVKKHGLKDYIVVSPDLTNSKIMKELGIKNTAIVKKRDLYADKAECIKRICIDKGEEKNVLIVDDIIASGATVFTAIKELKNSGCKKFFVATTHGFFQKNSLEKLKKKCVDVIASNSIPNEATQYNLKDKISEIVKRL
ncbi:MAG: ribose-phosphate diphosphokinase [archaeon]